MSTIVLVHGVWMDASSWRLVIPALRQAGHAIHAVQLPLTTFADDVAATKRVLARARGDVTLVGHSYGGAVITAAAADAPAVKKLVYITAFAPDAGETFGSLLGMNPPAAKVDLKPDEDGLLWITADGMQDAAAHDVDRATVELLASSTEALCSKAVRGFRRRPGMEANQELVSGDAARPYPEPEDATAAGKTDLRPGA